MKTKNKKKIINLKQEKGFTMQDLIIAFGIILLVGGTIGSTYLAIYTIQSDTKVDALATLYAIQITEYIDKISYEEVVNEININSIKQKFNISDKFTVNIDVANYEQDEENLDMVKKVKIELSYSFRKQNRKIVFNRLKIKEL